MNKYFLSLISTVFFSTHGVLATDQKEDFIDPLAIQLTTDSIAIGLHKGEKISDNEISSLFNLLKPLQKNNESDSNETNRHDIIAECKEFMLNMTEKDKTSSVETFMSQVDKLSASNKVPNQTINRVLNLILGKY